MKLLMRCKKAGIYGQLGQSSFVQIVRSTEMSVNSTKGHKNSKSQNSKRGVVRQNSVSISDFLTRVDEQVFRAMKKIAKVFHELEETFLPEIFNEENN